MTERPILMSAPMVRAILDGRKTQTRRVLRDQQPIDLGASMHGTHLSRRPVHDHGKLVGHRLAPVRCPYGQPGDRLWVRETWSHDGPDLATVRSRYEDLLAGGESYGPYYRATEVAPETLRWIPAIHMPRWACRLTVEVTGVRAERLHAISDDDCIAEGIEPHDSGDAREEMSFNRSAYAELWDALNAKRELGWATNPWVWVVSFRRCAAPQ